VQQCETDAPAEAVGTRERRAAAQHSVDLSEKPVLSVGGRDVMKHREARRSAESTVGKRHRRGVAADNIHPVNEALAQRAREFRVDLQRGEPTCGAGEHLRRRPEARAHLEDGVTQLQALERRWDKVLAHMALPRLTCAVPMVGPVHALKNRTSAGLGPDYRGT
jgi:hypothetical protein